ncbi:hypothetical protein [Nocardioides kribbensis]|uniref:DNA-binding protein n=1 Tax=Nocardioides kribbensis TaxID=305517 RepID=A0ABV1NY74_9ACTN
MDSFVTMSDIARIANVTRQAVTNWRSRTALLPFPSAAGVVGGVEQFDRDEVLDWLEATGRGLNDDARLDAPAVAVPDDLRVEDAVVMLALRAGMSEDVAPLTAAERIDLARELDPTDSYILAEVTELATDDALAEYVDGLLEASYGASDALDRLFASRAAQGSRGLTGDAVALVQELADACRTFLGPDGVAVELHLDPRDHGIATRFGTAGPQSARAARRVHAIDGVEIASSAGPLVKVVSVAGLDDGAALDAAGDVAVELDTGQIAIVIGPASALCDRLRGDLYEARKSALEMGSSDYGCALVASFKLPRGLWREAHRQSLGVWVLRGAAAIEAALVADLSGESVDASELAADLLGALEQTGARSYRYCRALRYVAVWTGDTVVPPGIGAQPMGSFDAMAAYDRLVGATIVTREPIPGFDVSTAREGTPSLSSSRSLGELVETGAIRRQSGSRIADEDLDAYGSVRVITADGGAPRWIDRLVEAERYRSAVHTEPGDVVFSTNPPRAIVDETGGAIVASPSRILRPDPARAGIGPRALAAAIDRMQGSSEWKTWLIPRFPADQVQRVEEALSAVDEHLVEMRKHEAAAAALITSLIQGVAAGSVTLEAPDTEKKAG